MASRLIDLISKNKLHVPHTFSTNQQKTKLHVQHAFLSFPCRCFAPLQRCFVRLKRQTSWLHIFLWRNCRNLLSEMFILSVLCCGQTRRKRSETSCKITLIQNYLLDQWLVFENRLYWNYISVFLTSWPVFWNSILRSVRRCNWYVTQRNLVSCPEVSQTLTLNKPYFLFVIFILI